MRISIKHKFAFLCTPKCASTSIESAITPYSDIIFSGSPQIKHINVKNFNEFILPFYNKNLIGKLSSFCIIRDPIERLESIYRYRKRNKLKNKAHSRHKEAYTGNMSFNEFIRSVIKAEGKIPHSHVKSQADFVSLPDNSIGVDYIFTLEQMDKVSEFISDKVGKKVTIPKLNKSKDRSRFSTLNNPKNIDRLTLDENLKEQLIQYIDSDIKLYNFVTQKGGYEKEKHLKEFTWDSRKCD